MNSIVQYGLYIAIPVLLAIPLGEYMAHIMRGERVFLSKVLAPCERGIYRLLRIQKEEDMGWKKYAGCALLFSAVCLVVLMILHRIQNLLPLNPEGLPGTSWHLAFNTAVSFVTNTNWQAYSGETTLSYFTQMMGLTVQNFVSAAMGIATLFALIRGFTRVEQKGIGNFWTDMTRIILYILIPLSILVSLAIISQGVVQNFAPYETVTLVEPIVLEDGTQVAQQIVPMGPAASQIAIKQLGTNGGGFFGVNSAHPFENPTPLSNLIEMVAILVIPAALCFTFGKGVNDKKQGVAIFLAMMIIILGALTVTAVQEQGGTAQLEQDGAVDVRGETGAGGNMEGKETRFGIPSSVTWTIFTTSASNGAVNSMLDSYTPIGGMIPLLMMELGEVVFGGAGCGLYGMLAFAILTVFIAGLMVGRTPEYLGKKIEPYEMRMAMLICLAAPVAILTGSGIAAVLPQTAQNLTNSGAHGFTEMLYAYSSAGANNGSAFAGFNANTPFFNVSLGVSMLFVRFVPMVAALAIAGSMAQKKKVAVSAGVLSTSNAMFIGLLIGIVLLVGALSFFPALSLGPIAEFVQGMA